MKITPESPDEGKRGWREEGQDPLALADHVRVWFSKFLTKPLKGLRQKGRREHVCPLLDKRRKCWESTEERMSSGKCIESERMRKSSPDVQNSSSLNKNSCTHSKVKYGQNVAGVNSCYI